MKGTPLPALPLHRTPWHDHRTAGRQPRTLTLCSHAREPEPTTEHGEGRSKAPLLPHPAAWRTKALPPSRDSASGLAGSHRGEQTVPTRSPRSALDGACPESVPLFLLAVHVAIGGAFVDLRHTDHPSDPHGSCRGRAGCEEAAGTLPLSAHLLASAELTGLGAVHPPGLV